VIPQVSGKDLFPEVESFFNQGEWEMFLKKAYQLSQKAFQKDKRSEVIKTTYEYYFFSGSKEWKVPPEAIRENLLAMLK
jgi:hypothetical protein